MINNQEYAIESIAGQHQARHTNKQLRQDVNKWTNYQNIRVKFRKGLSEKGVKTELCLLEWEENLLETTYEEKLARVAKLSTQTSNNASKEKGK